MDFRIRYLLLLAALAVYHLQGLPAQESWGDDWAQYAVHAMNLREGAPYDRLPYLFTPESSQYFPAVYPPGYPVLLAGISVVAGWNVWAWKAASALLWLGSLAALPFVFRGRLRDWQILALMALLGVSPLLWNLKTHLLADIPYLFLSLLTLGCIRPREDGEYGWGKAAVAGVLMTMAISFRTVGVVLPLSLGAVWLWTWVGRAPETVLAYRRHCFRVLTVALPFVTLLLLALPTAHTSYLQNSPVQAKPLWLRIPWNLKHYLLAESLDYAGGNRVILAIFLLCIAMGVWRLWSGRRWDVLDVHTLLIFAVISIWPYTDPRFLLPAIPALLLYAVDGWDGVRQKLPERMRMPATAALLLLIAAGYARQFPVQRQLAQNSIADPPARALLDWVGKSIPNGEVIVFSKPRTLALQTGKTALATPPLSDPAVMNRRLCELGVQWVITFSDTTADQEYLQPWMRLARNQLDRRFSNERHTVYRMKPGACPVPAGI